MSQAREIEEKIKKIKPVLKKEYHVKEIGIFGSYARGEESSKSDVDVLVDFNRLPDLWRFINLENYLSDILHKKVDLVRKQVIRKELRDNILKEVINI